MFGQLGAPLPNSSSSVTIIIDIRAVRNVAFKMPTLRPLVGVDGVRARRTALFRPLAVAERASAVAA